MREYKFRGKIIDHRTRFLKTLGYKVGDWIYGENISTEHDDIEPDKIHVFICGIRVDPDTVGQYTGVKDFKGNPVYEGDILINPDSDEDTKAYGDVYWNRESATFLIGFELDESAFNAGYYTVVGNILDNPELTDN